jgi:acyl-CoA thioester hydrolase
MLGVSFRATTGHAEWQLDYPAARRTSMSATKFDPIRLDADRYPFALPVAPRFADMDMLQHINNLSLAEYHEEARIRFLREVFGNNFLFSKRNFRLLVAKASYDYLREALYPQPLEARVAVARIGNSSFELALALFQEGHCVCLADVVLVHVADDGPAPLPAELRMELQTRCLRHD